MNNTKRPQFKRAREGAGLSLSQASRVLGVDRRELAHIENGDKPPAVWIQDRMIQHYEVSRAYLITGEPHTFIDHLFDGTPLEIAMKIAESEESEGE